MRNGYNHHHHEQQLYHPIRHGSTTFFLPMLCRLSIKDVKLHNSNQPSSSANDLSDDNHKEPCSPKVSCMGQVKRNNRVIGLPTSSTAITAPLNPKLKYTKLKKLFSAKNFTPRNQQLLKTSTTVTVVDSRKSTKPNDRVVDEVNVSELDPPLPVVKKVKPAAEDGGLWKRRSGGAALKSLQIQHIHLPAHNNLLHQLTTV